MAAAAAAGEVTQDGMKFRLAHGRSVGLWHVSRRRSAALKLGLYGGNQTLQCSRVHIAHKACELGGNSRRLLLLLLLMLNGRRVRRLRGRLAVHVVAWRRWLCMARVSPIVLVAVSWSTLVRLTIVRRRTGGLGSQNYLGGNGRIQVDVLVEADVGAACRPVKGLDGHFAEALCAHVQVNYSVYTLCCLSLDDLVLGHARMEEHVMSGESLGLESALDPRNKVTVDVGLEQDLHIRNVSAIPSR